MRKYLFLVWFFCSSLLVTHSDGAAFDDRAQLRLFVDKFMLDAMQKHDVSAAVVSIVSEDKTLLSQGYGLADTDLKSAVDPQKTLFRIGSVSKLFTYVALMQLHEQGELDFNTDVNQYLKSYQVPYAFDQVITVADLVTHTAGFEDRIVGLFGKQASAMKSYAALINEDMPKRVRPAGEISSYSNHGIGLAGLIIEEISGFTWQDYVQEFILTPLKMSNASAAQPLPSPLKSQLAKVYNNQGQQQGFEYIPLGAAGGMSASGNDMARFLQMFLNGGELEGRRVLTTESVLSMQQVWHGQHPQFRSRLFGFGETSRNGEFMIGHAGGTLSFFSHFYLNPKARLGFFMSASGVDGPALRQQLYNAFMTEYFPNPQNTEVLSPPSELNLYLGEYTSFRHPFTRASKLLQLTGSLSLRSAADGVLALTPLGGATSHYREISPLLFQNIESGGKLLLKLGNQKQPLLFINDAGGSYYKLQFWQTPYAQGAIVLLCFLLLAALLVSCCYTLLTHKLTSNQLSLWRAAILLSSSFLISIVMLITLLNKDIVFGLPIALNILLNLNYMLPLFWLLHFGLFVNYCRFTGLPRLFYFQHGSLSLVSLIMCCEYFYWNLFSWST